MVLFPTETVYGIAANAADKAAVARLREAKGRAANQPFTIHLGRRGDARRFINKPTPLLSRFVRRAWPGPLTLVCDVPRPAETPIAQHCPVEQLGEVFHNSTVGLRCPDHPASAALLAAVDAPVVASSANRAGQSPPTDFDSAMAAIGDSVDYAIAAGRTRHSAASTIVELHGDSWRIAREGALDERTLRRIARSATLFVCTGNSCRSPMAEFLYRAALARKLEVSPERLEALGYVAASAGTFAMPGAAASAGAVAELARRGIDARGHRSQPLSVELIHGAERIYVMSPEHRAAVLELAPAAAPRVHLLSPTGSIVDPFGGSAESYSRAAAQIEAAVDVRAEEALHEDRDW